MKLSYSSLMSSSLSRYATLLQLATVRIKNLTKCLVDSGASKQVRWVA